MYASKYSFIREFTNGPYKGMTMLDTITFVDDKAAKRWASRVNSNKHVDYRVTKMFDEHGKEI